MIINSVIRVIERHVRRDSRYITYYKVRISNGSRKMMCTYQMPNLSSIPSLMYVSNYCTGSTGSLCQCTTRTSIISTMDQNNYVFEVPMSHFIDASSAVLSVQLSHFHFICSYNPISLEL